MKLPFTVEQFLEVFEKYNTTVYPIQYLFVALAVLTVALLFSDFHYRDKIVSLYLTLLWLWIGIVYHLMFFARINPAANLFGALFITQALLFFYFGFLKEKFSFRWLRNKTNIFGLVVFLYALVVYPLLNIQFGHTYPYSPTFGLPCPTTIFTFGILTFTITKIKWYLYIIPLIWSLIGATAASNLGIYEDLGLLASGVTTSIILLKLTA